MAVSLRASERGLEMIDIARKKKGWNKDDEIWYKEAETSKATLKRFWAGQAVLKDTFERICKAVGEDWHKIVDNSTPDEELPDWQGCCERMLDSHRWLTSNQITARDGIRFELFLEDRGSIRDKSIYIPVDLVELEVYKLIQTSNFSPEQGSQLYVPEGKRLDQNQFLKTFEEVHNENQEQPARIAIVGEPGAGKTTCLQKIAFLICHSTKNLPIWISLGNLKGKSIEDYLLENWLKAATKMKVLDKNKDDLIKLFKTRQIWLLLDGVDEIATEPVSALAMIAQELTGWLGEAAVVLTCRNNVWYEGKNPLEGFKVYQVSGFIDKWIKQFIEQWFANDNREVGKKLLEHLFVDKPDPQWQRLKDMAKNPLRLALLCYMWQRLKGDFPDSKLKLYQEIVDILYEWKKDMFTEVIDKRKSLELALSELAISGIEKNLFYFTSSYLQKEITDTSLLKLSLQIGLLNQIGTTKDSVNEKLYTFFHPSLQEYFAAHAKVINKKADYKKADYEKADYEKADYEKADYEKADYEKADYEFFLQIKECNYRILEPQWSEVFLIWREKGEKQKEEARKLLYKLISLTIVNHEQDKISEKAAETVKRLLYALDEIQRQHVARGLKESWFRKIEKDNNNNNNYLAVSILKSLIEITQDSLTRLEAVWSLRCLGANDWDAYRILKMLAHQAHIEKDQILCQEVKSSLITLYINTIQDNKLREEINLEISLIDCHQ